MLSHQELDENIVTRLAGYWKQIQETTITTSELQPNNLQTGNGSVTTFTNLAVLEVFIGRLCFLSTAPGLLFPVFMLC